MHQNFSFNKKHILSQMTKLFVNRRQHNLLIEEKLFGLFSAKLKNSAFKFYFTMLFMRDHISSLSILSLPVENREDHRSFLSKLLCLLQLFPLRSRYWILTALSLLQQSFSKSLLVVLCYVCPLVPMLMRSLGSYFFSLSEHDLAICISWILLIHQTS